MNPDNNRIDAIDECLPQTQCTRCGYPRCYAYAEAIVAGDADINQCPPGGDVTIRALAKLAHTPIKPLNPKFGEAGQRHVAIIRETECIGCTICIQACPVDAILGSGKLMHTVLRDECTGCELCVSPCPVDCIDMARLTANSSKLASPWPEFSIAQVARARKRTENRITRLSASHSGGYRNPRPEKANPSAHIIRKEIQASIARVRARRSGKTIRSDKYTNE